jgi:hypothetical protein
MSREGGEAPAGGVKGEVGIRGVRGISVWAHPLTALATAPGLCLPSPSPTHPLLQQAYPQHRLTRLCRSVRAFGFHVQCTKVSYAPATPPNLPFPSSIHSPATSTGIPRSISS